MFSLKELVLNKSSQVGKVLKLHVLLKPGYTTCLMLLCNACIGKGLQCEQGISSGLCTNLALRASRENFIQYIHNSKLLTLVKRNPSNCILF